MARTRRGGSSMAVNSKHLEPGMGRMSGVREARGRGGGWRGVGVARGGGGGGAAVANQYLEFRYIVHVYKQKKRRKKKL